MVLKSPYLDKLVEYEWVLEYPLDGFDEDGSDVEARHLGLDGLDPALQQPRDARVRVVPAKKNNFLRVRKVNEYLFTVTGVEKMKWFLSLMMCDFQPRVTGGDEWLEMAPT